MSTETHAVEVTLQIVCDDESNTTFPAVAEFGRWVNAAVGKAARSIPQHASVTIRLVDEEECCALNGRFRGQPSATNVLAFPASLPPLPDGVLTETELGDIVVCVAVAIRESREQGKSFVAHVAHLVVHGSLHLLGFDHMDAVEADAMEALESSIMQNLGFPDPYLDEPALQDAES